MLHRKTPTQGSKDLILNVILDGMNALMAVAVANWVLFVELEPMVVMPLVAVVVATVTLENTHVLMVLVAVLMEKFVAQRAMVVLLICAVALPPRLPFLFCLS
jgi:hypothetical protein